MRNLVILARRRFDAGRWQIIECDISCVSLSAIEMRGLMLTQKLDFSGKINMLSIVKLHLDHIDV